MKMNKEVKYAMAEEFNWLETTEDRKQFTEHIRYMLSRIDDNDYLEEIKKLQNYINVVNLCYKVNSNTSQEIGEENIEKEI
jgi:hypothetical protein